MERQANYALVGAITVSLLVAGLVFIVWLANFQFNRTFDDYRIFFRGPVSGLSRGGEVQFNGIRVGEITRIALDRRDPNKVVTDIRIDHGTPVRADSTAQPVAQGITGVKFIQISPGSVDRPLLRKISKEHPPVIAASRSRMENVVNNVTELTRGGAEALDRINRLLSDQNMATISRSIDDIASVTGEVRARKELFARLDSTFTKLDHAASDLQVVAASARGTMGGADGTLAQVAASAAELRKTVAATRSLIATMEGPAAELSSTTVPNVNAALHSMQQAAEEFDRLASRLQQDPRGLVVHPEGRELEIPQ